MFEACNACDQVIKRDVHCEAGGAVTTAEWLGVCRCANPRWPTNWLDLPGRTRHMGKEVVASVDEHQPRQRCDRKYVGAPEAKSVFLRSC